MSILQNKNILLFVFFSFLFFAFTPACLADLGLSSDDFGHSQVSGKKVNGERIDGKGVNAPGGSDPGEGDGNEGGIDDGGSEGEHGGETPTCQAEEGSSQTEGTACKSCEDSTQTSCNDDNCLKVFSHVNLYTRQYQDDVVDMKVKAQGGFVKLYRIYTDGRWQFEHEFNRLDLSRVAAGTIVKSKLSYVRDEDGLYHYRTFTLEKQKDNYRWQNKRGGYVLYDFEGNIMESGDRTGVLARFHYEGKKLVRISDRRDTPIFHFTYEDDRINKVNDEYDREVNYTWNGENLLAVEDVLGFTTTYSYDDNQKLSIKEDEAGRKFFIAYHPDGAVKSVTSKMGGGHWFSYSHDKVTDEHYTRVNSYMGKVREYWFDDKGETKRLVVNGELSRKIEWIDDKKTITNEMGSRVTRSYDKNRNLIREEYMDGTSKSFSYDSYNNLISSIDENGVENRFSHTPQGFVKTSRFAYSTNDELLVEYGYDKNGNLTSKTIFNNNQPITTGYKHDDKGNVLRQTDAMGGETTLVHDHMGNAIKITNEMGLVTTLVYDKMGNLIRSTTPNHQSLQYQYDPAGRRTLIRDDAGGVSRFVYDDQDNLREQVDALGGVKKFNFDKDNRLTKKVDEEGKYIVFFYEGGSERITKIIDGMGNEISMTYRGFENCGSCNTTLSKNPVMIKYPTFTRQYSYDTKGRVIEKSDILEGKTFSERYQYDKAGNLISSTDKAGREIIRQYDKQYRIVALTDTMGNTTRMEYDTRGNLTKLTDAKKQTTKYSYDRLGRKIKETNPLGKSSIYSYDNAGRLLSLVDAKGQQLSYSYNEENGYLDAYILKKNKDDFPGQAVKFNYDQQGRMAGYDDGTTSAVYTYDSLGRRTKEEVNFGTFTSSHSYSYYRNGKKKSYVAPGDLTHNYSYNPINKLEKIEIENVGELGYSDYNWLKPTRVSFPGGQRIDRHDGLLRLVERKAMNSKGKEFLNLAYTHNEIGNIISKKTKSSDESITSYTYDELQRLVEVKKNNLATESYQYDQVGNRLHSGDNSYSYDENSQLLAVEQSKYRYDENGSPVSIQSGTEEKTLTYTIENRLEKFSAKGIEARYYYDPFGRRLSKLVNGKITWFYYTDEGLVAEFDESGNLTTSYSYQPDGQWSTDPVVTSRSTNHYFYHNDHIGAPTHLTDNEGSVVWNAEYTSFGDVEKEEKDIENNLRLPGQYFDAESGLHYNWYRFYNPATGRYLTADPIGLAGGINQYAYVGGNPTNYIDPMGLAYSPRNEHGIGRPLPYTKDGLSYLEGANHYFNGFGEDLEVPFHVIDPGYGVTDFINPCAYGVGSRSINQGKGHNLNSPKTFFTIAGPGRIQLRITGELIVTVDENCNKSWYFVGKVTADVDTFDFDPRPWGERKKHNEIFTRIIHYTPFGTEFDVYFPGHRQAKTGGSCD